MALNRLKELIDSGVSFIWLRTNEYDYYIDKLVEMYQSHTKKTYKWDIETGLRDTKNNKLYAETKEPSDCLNYTCELIESLCIILDFDKFIHEQKFIRKLLNHYNRLNRNKTTFVFISADVEIPIELLGYVYTVDAGIASKEMLKEALDEFLFKHNIGEKGNSNTTYTLDCDKMQLVTRGIGLSLAEYNNALKLSLYHAKQTHTITSKYIERIKRERMNELGGLRMLEESVTFDDLCGLEHLKKFAKTMVESGKGKGILLMGVPGSGKTAFANALGNETNRIALALDFSLLMGAHNGETEHLTKLALDTADKLEPCILVIDEIEKGLAGISDDNEEEAGTARRQGGIFLKWLNDHKSDVYVIATANDIEHLPPEYLRAERWDTLFYVDIPNRKQQAELLKLYTTKYQIPPQEYPNTTRWTGAEIKSLCRLAHSLNISLLEAQNYINPICKSMPLKIREIQLVGQRMCLDASDRDEFEDYDYS